MILKPEDVPAYVAQYSKVEFCEHVTSENLGAYAELYAYSEGGTKFGDPIVQKIGCHLCLDAALEKADVKDADELFFKQSKAFMGLGSDRVFVDDVGISSVGGSRKRPG